MSREPRFDFPAELPEWRRSGPYLLIALALHLAVLALPKKPAMAAVPPPLQVRVLAVQQTAMPEPLPVSAPLPLPAKSAAERPVQQKRRPILAMSPEQDAPSASALLVAVSPESAIEADTEILAALPPAAGPVWVAAHYNAAYLNNPEPKYPPLSRRLGEEGKVELRVRVTADGRAGAVELSRSSNYARLDEAARQAVAGWRFVPARRGDEAVEALVIVPIVFRLDG